MKKQLSVKELSKLVSIPEGTIRAWTLKPIEGEVYEVGKVNYTSLKSGLSKYFEDKEFVEKFGFEITDIEITKSTKKSTRSYVEVEELEIDKEYDIHNYSMVSRWTLGEIVEIYDKKVYVFVNTDLKYKALNEDDLDQKNIKIEEIEDENE